MGLLDKLVSHWPLEEDGEDVFGSNDFTPSSITWDSSNKKFGVGSALLGSGSSLSASDSASLEVGYISVAFWVKSTDTGSNLSFIRRYTDSPNRVFRFYLTSGGLHGFFYRSDDENSPDFGNTTNICDGAWHLIVITSDGANFKYYIDGSLVKTTAWAFALKTSASVPFVVGVGNPIESGVADFNIQSLSYFSEALTDSEVLELWASGSGLPWPWTPPISYHISGTVTLAGSPVEGAVVRCIRQSDNVALASAETDSSGEYLFEDLDEEELYHLAVEYEADSLLYNALSLWDVSPVEVED